MSKTRRLLKAGGVTRRTMRMVLSLTVTTMPDKEAPGVDKPPDRKNQHAHLNMDCGGLTDAEALKVLERAKQEIEDRIVVAGRAKAHDGLAMIQATALAASMPQMKASSPLGQVGLDIARGKELAFLNGMNNTEDDHGSTNVPSVRVEDSQGAD